MDKTKSGFCLVAGLGISNVESLVYVLQCIFISLDLYSNFKKKHATAIHLYCLQHY